MFLPSIWLSLCFSSSMNRFINAPFVPSGTTYLKYSCLCANQLTVLQYPKLFDLVQARLYWSSMWILSVASTSKLVCTSAVAGATRTYTVSENIEHFAAKISRVEALGQSRSKSSFQRIGTEAMIG